jgi:hypothetical protein
MPRWPWTKRERDPTAEEVLDALDPATRQRFRDLDLAGILARIERFAVAAVETAWTRIGERRKVRPDAGIDDPVVQALVRDSARAVVNFARHQLYDPSLRAARIQSALDQQAARWQTLAAADPALVQFALAVLAEQHAHERAHSAPEPPSPPRA